MTIVKSQRHLGPKNQLWTPFGAAAALFFVLCIWGGFSGPIGERSLHLSRNIIGDNSFTIPSGRFILLFSARPEIIG
jgi:hypothetical protein